MTKWFKITPYWAGISIQKRLIDFFFQLHYDKDYFFVRFFQFGIDGGIQTCHSVEYTSFDPYSYSEKWVTRKQIGLFIQLKAFNIRFELHLKPITYSKTVC